MSDPFDLQRFLTAQQSVYSDILAELRSGRKQSHWIWFIFPQIQGLGYSSTAQKYAISGLPEAEAYLSHPTLGPRLRECTGLVNQLKGKTILQILGSPDDLKFGSSMTLFARASPDNSIFLQALDKYFQGEMDRLTLAKLES